MKQATAQKERLNLYIRKDVVEDLRKYVPARERNRFIAEVLTREVRRLKLREALEMSAGAWRDEDHPELASPEDIDNWIRRFRAGMGWDRLIQGCQAQDG
ncbi:MAG: hypothetical protein Q7O66_04095 [Dehalococcoidia bacterium]|nr:hypothetical protein [Dehalococcoidia bacterium]